MAISIDEVSIADQVLRKIFWRVVPFVGLLYFVAFLDRVNIGFAALTMNRDLMFSSTVYGTGAGIFFLGYFLFGVPSNLILEKIGARLWIGLILIVWGVFAVAMAFVSGRRSFYFVRFLLGTAESGFFPGIIVYLTYWFPARYRAGMTGAFMAALPLSSAIGAPVSTALLGANGYGLKGWQWLFILEGMPAVVLGFLVFVLLADNPANAKWLKQVEKDWLRDMLQDEPRPPGSVHTIGLAQTFRNRKVWFLSLMYFCVVIGLYGFGLWLPQIIKGFGGLTNLQVGFVTIVPYSAAAAAMFLWGRQSDKTGERFLFVAIPAGIGAIGLAASAYLGSAPLLAMVALSVSAIGIYCVFPAFWTLPTAMLSGTSAATGIGLINSVGNLGGFLGPFLVGYFRDRMRNYTGGLLFLAAWITFAGMLALWMRRHATMPRLSTVTAS